jgi:SEC-C motif
MSKIGRNQPCHCGSGKKYKRCHGDPVNQDRINRAFSAAEVHRRQHEAAEKQRAKQQGFGKPIISTTVGDNRLVAVGNTVHFAQSWKTFPDFLLHYAKKTLGPEWGTKELQKSETQMHPVALWYRKTAQHQASYAGKPGEVFSAPETGATRAYLELAYNLYLLEHNAELRDRLIGRLKTEDQFYGALSEIRVAGMFVRAGYAVKFDDEDDSSRTHCEYDVVRQKTGKGFSVEVKTRHWAQFPQDDVEGRSQVKIHVGRLLRQALAKQASNDRLIFIELAMPDEAPSDMSPTEPWWMQSAIDGIKETAQVLREQGKDVPSAIVVVGNHPQRFHLDGTRSVIAYAVDGIGATDFRAGLTGTVRQAVQFRKRHADFVALWESIQQHRHIPQTFDGTSHHLAFGDHPPALVVGQQYLVPDVYGNEIAATLIDAVAIPSEKSIYGIYRSESGQFTCTTPMTESEAAAYAESSDTFFGVIKRAESLQTPLELYDFFFESYGKSTREQLLQFMATRPDLAAIENLPREELAEIYCEGLVYGVLARAEVARARS